ncbi:MAG: DUF4384 domain-containing protein [Spirochaetales bacterium]|nr:DUF4384 domain-containing protein [Spirochaetales bacterium]
MRYKIKRITFFICTLFLLPQSIFPAGNQEQSKLQEKMNPAVTWEFLCKDPAGNIKVLQYNEIFEITAGIHYKIQFKTSGITYIYIFLYDTDGNILLLFPENMNSLRTSLSPDTIYSIPPENDQWFSLEQNTRIRNLYILAVNKRQKKLEKFIKQYFSSFNKGNHDTNREESIKTNLLNEIIRIDRSHNCYVTYVEKPNTFLGDVQDDEKRKELEWIMEKNE